jgi:hypothetical protein
MIDTFNNLYDQCNYISIRNKFKIQSNNFLWLIILEIIELLRLEINLVKVKAHSDNVFNNRVDYLTNIVQRLLF